MVQGFFVGMVANLFPFAPGGVGAVDAGMIGAFVIFGLPSTTVFAAVLVYRRDRLLAADPARDRRLLPAAPDGARWEAEGRPVRGAVGPSRSAAASVLSVSAPSPLLQKVKY